MGRLWIKIEKQYGKAKRLWVMDRGIRTEAALARMCQSDEPVSYRIGTPKGQLTALEAGLTRRAGTRREMTAPVVQTF